MTARTLFFPLALAFSTLALVACQPPSGDQTAFDARVKDYLMKHPEDLRAALDNMQAKEDADEAKAEAAADIKAKAALPALRAALERDPRDFVANPNGSVTVTEFYDYRCPHCISIAPRVLALIQSRPDVRFVFKEMPIFGDTSEHAARAALAAKAQGKDYLGLYAALMAAHPLTDSEIDRIASAKGVNIEAMNSPQALAKDKVQLDDVQKLAEQLAIDGTPGFIVGDTIVHGEDYDALTAAIAKAGGKG
ncbi:MAG TPA: thioredoxin domain-containing protein [Caulobacteraceae bacterium]|nr:thioredoxin domain-containing protein [Caulobacteraceae bacterium]